MTLTDIRARAQAYNAILARLATPEVLTAHIRRITAFAIELEPELQCAFADECEMPEEAA